MNEQKTFFFETEVRWQGNRQGRLESGSLPAIVIDAPPEFKGHEGLWTAEHLFVASVNACFMTTFLAIAENSKLEIATLCSTARGKLEKVEGAGYQITEVTIRPRVVIRSAHDLGRAARILEKAKQSCFISNSIKSAIKLEPELYNEQTPIYPCAGGGSTE